MANDKRFTKEKKARALQVAWRRATKRTSTLTMDEARELVHKPPDCPYCNERIDWKDISIDHKTPTSRGGLSQPHNLVWCCKSCNATKGDFTDREWEALMVFLEPRAEMKQRMLSRLRAAGLIFSSRPKYRRLRRKL